MEKRRFQRRYSLSLPREACRSLGHIFDGILGIKSRIKVMPTLKFVVPEPWQRLNLLLLLPTLVPDYSLLPTPCEFYADLEKVGDRRKHLKILCFERRGSPIHGSILWDSNGEQ